MNDSKNMILAVVLSALVLLGWTWAANKYFPTANPPSTKVVNGKQQPAPQPRRSRARPRPRKRQRQFRPRSRGTPRVSIRTPSLMGSINLKGAQIDDLLLVNQRQTIAPELAAGAAAVAARRSRRLHRRVRLDGSGRAGADARHDVDRRRAQLAPGRPVTSSTQMPDGTRYQLKIAVDEGYLFTVRQSVLNASGKPLTVRPIGLVSRSDEIRRPSTLDQPCRPDRRVRRQGRLRRQLEGPRQERKLRRSAMSAAGSASPTNIG